MRKLPLIVIVAALALIAALAVFEQQHQGT
jgi:hypothetical protein